jgi:predicted nuclease of restriction endonuclease-like (RecB) superfamily
MKSRRARKTGRYANSNARSHPAFTNASLLSRNKKGIRKLAAEGQIISKPEDMLKEPYTLEFLGLAEKASYSESDLEQAIIDRIEHFLLELGKGFLFEARQKRFTFDEEHFFVDLVFYNRLLRCYVLVDLKVDKLTHQDLGQMQMYVNYFDRRVKLAEENPTVGILLCKRKKEAIVELTLPKDANIHANTSSTFPPSNCSRKSFSNGPATKNCRHEPRNLLRKIRPLRRRARCGGEDAGTSAATGSTREARNPGQT